MDINADSITAAYPRISQRASYLICEGVDLPVSKRHAFKTQHFFIRQTSRTFTQDVMEQMRHRWCSLQPQPARNNHPLNVRSTRIKRSANSIAQISLNLKFSRVPIPSVDADGVHAGFYKGLAQIQLGNCRFHYGGFACLL